MAGHRRGARGRKRACRRQGGVSSQRGIRWGSADPQRRLHELFASDLLRWCMKRARNLSVLALAMAVVTAIVPAAAVAAEAGPSAADFARLQKEVAEQRQLIIQMMQIEQQRYDMLLRLMQSGGGA